MIVRYKRNLSGTFMVIKEDIINENDYKIKMITKNKIAGLLETSIGYLNNELELVYNISSKQNLKEYLLREKLSYEQVKNIINSIISLNYEIEKYLLNLEEIMLSEEYIYIDKDSKNIEYCYCKNEGGSFIDKLKVLIQKLIQTTNHADKDAVNFIYGIFEICNKDNFAIQDFEEYMNKENCKESETKFVKEEYDYKYKTEDEFSEKLNSIFDDNIEQKIDYSYVDNDENKKKSIFDKISEIMIGKRREKLSVVCDNYEEEYNYIQEEKLKPDSCNASEIDRDEETETMFIKDILLKKDRQLFSMSEMDDIHINSFPFTVGKSSKSDGVINDNSVSRLHAKFTFEKDIYYIEDLNSKNSTMVNDEIITPYEIVKIDIGDKITIASFNYIFR